jgi:hypothetical protein
MSSFAPAADQSMKISGIGTGEPSCKSSNDSGEVATDWDGDAPGLAYRAIVTEQCARTNTSLETDPSTVRVIVPFPTCPENNNEDGEIGLKCTHHLPR